MGFRNYLERTEMRNTTFAIPGGKGRMTSWLFNYFPTEGNKYLEPFAGYGNVFYAAKNKLHFKEWHLNDLYHADFLKALINADTSLLPDTVPKEDFDKWKTAAIIDKHPHAVILRSRCTYLSGGWDKGHSGDSGTHVGYKKQNFEPLIHTARALLTAPHVSITSLDWAALPWGLYNSSDFVYLDPPYHETEVSTYPNIDHDTLIAHLKKATYRWVLSGNDTELYLRKKYW